MIWTFWEGRKPEYIKCCMDTWRLPYTELNFASVNWHTDIDIEAVKKYSLPQVSDIVRAHVLRDNGGVWLDADTIMLGHAYPAFNVIGNPATRVCDTGICQGSKGDDFFVRWCEYQDRLIGQPSTGWSMFVNDFTDGYIKSHPEVRIHDVRDCCPELNYWDPWNHEIRYQRFWFGDSYHLSDIPAGARLIALHNSWTPQRF